MNKTRLQKVVDHLRKVRLPIAKGDAPQFDMDYWGKLSKVGVFKGKKNLECVTSACAIGHTAHLFNKQGFHLEIDPQSDGVLIPIYKGLSQWHAISAFFDITENEGMYLFHPDEYDQFDGPIPVSEVADRIENFIHDILE